jgi:GNAT superfamily N-acetyltransferase
VGEAGIRRARGEDCRALVELWVDLIDHHRRLGVARASRPALREALAEEIARALRRESSAVWVAEAQGGAVAFLLAEAGANAAGSIHELFVTQARRRAGTATALVAEADAWLGRRGADRVRVRVESVNTDALDFWSALGFEPCADGDEGPDARLLERGVCYRPAP